MSTTRLTIDLPKDVYKKIKITSAIMETTMRQVICNCIYDSLFEPNEETRKAIEECEKGENLLGPYKSVEQMFKSFEAEDA